MSARSRSTSAPSSLAFDRAPNSGTHHCQPSGAGPQAGSGSQPSGGRHPSGVGGQFGGGLKRYSTANPPAVHDQPYDPNRTAAPAVGNHRISPGTPLDGGGRGDSL